jgi:ATP-dependent Clp protease ATP-binding subunit ClpA
LRRALEKYIEDFLAEEFLKGALKEGSAVHLDLGGNDQIVIEQHKNP